MLEKSSVIAMYNRFFLVYKKIMMQHLIFDHSRHNILICGKSVPPILYRSSWVYGCNQ